MEQEIFNNILVLKDLKTAPDVVCEYTAKDQKSPLIIDNGSYQCRVGFAHRKVPQLVFKNLVAKPRKDRNKKEAKEEIQQTPPATLVGNDIVNIETMRFQIRTQFDKNVVTHFYLQEQIYDYIFAHLGINTEGSVNNPIVITEAMVNPNYCRSLMSELLFECYQVPSVFYGIDSLFSFNFNDNIKGTALIVSIGYAATHVIPFIDGHHIVEKVRRINVGGFHILNYMHRLLQLKYPMHVNNITLSRIEELLHEHCRISNDYTDDLKKWACHDFYEENIRKIQLPFTQATTSTSLLTAEQKIEKKKEMSRRLAEINARKREERLSEEEDQLQRMEEILESFDDEDTEDFEMGLKEFTLSSYEELEKAITATKVRIDKIKTKMLAAESGVTEEKQVVIPQPPAGMNIDDWLNEVRDKKNAILEKKQIRRQRRADLAKRRTAAAQERMRIISRLAGKEKGKIDDFGSRDEDWDVYKAISREQDSDSEVENEKLLEIDEILRHHDPMLNEDEVKLTPAEYNQLHFGVEAIRGPEILFQPSSMIGICEAGLAETIDYVLKLFPTDVQQRLVDNIFITGGASKLPGLIERLEKELLEMRPFQSTFKVRLAKDPSLDAWNGARKFATTGSNVHNFSISKKEYHELGSEYIKENCLSNKYFKTPLAPKVDGILM